MSGSAPPGVIVGDGMALSLYVSWNLIGFRKSRLLFCNGKLQTFYISFYYSLSQLVESSFRQPALFSPRKTQFTSCKSKIQIKNIRTYNDINNMFAGAVRSRLLRQGDGSLDSMTVAFLAVRSFKKHAHELRARKLLCF